MSAVARAVRGDERPGTILREGESGEVPDVEIGATIEDLARVGLAYVLLERFRDTEELLDPSLFCFVSEEFSPETVVFWRFDGSDMIF